MVSEERRRQKKLWDKSHYRVVGCKIDMAMMDTVTARAEEGGISRAEWVKQAIREKIKKKEW